MSENMHLKEYGSSIQKMVNYLLTIDDREKRTRQAYVMVELMRQLHPNLKDGQDYGNKLWDDLYLMSNFRLDVDGPYPPPSPDARGQKPQKIAYAYRNLRYKHFGHNVNLLVRRAVDTDDAEERRGFVSYLVRLMKGFYTTWNKENVEDETIYQSILDISRGMLAPDIALIRSEGLVEANPREAENEQSQRIGRSGRQPNNNFPVPKQGKGMTRQERRERYRNAANNTSGNGSNSTNGGGGNRDAGPRNFRGNNNNRRRR
jgi:hypothetical protein